MRVAVGSMVLSGCLLLACSSGHKGGRIEDAGLDAQGSITEVPVGEDVDIDGDGVPDGVAVDDDGDGTSDGVDTNGDGRTDRPLPGADASLPFVEAGAPYPTDDSGAVLCGEARCACSDGLDNDMDGVSDLLDPECVSTWDNDEGSLATGISGDNRDEACQDCFFDGNSGAGDDGCRVPTSCITLGNASSGRGSCNTCEQTDKCQRFCQAFTPNGCDCFGCCGIRVGGEVKNVLLGGACNIDGTTLDGCTACVPSTTCINECGKCELCPGKALSDLPPECFVQPTTDGGAPTGQDASVTPPAYTCDDGQQLCGAGQPACPSGALCQFGCCTLSPIPL